MSMSRTVVILIVSVFVAAIASVTLLLALGRDASSLIQLLATILIPGVISLVTLSRVEKTRDATEKVVEQTNGRMTELISNNRALAEQVVALGGTESADVDPDHEGAYGTDENGKHFLRRG